ncbi:fumarylacetoacetate hydrolase family protein [Amycolatopsis endophytica]|uniref:2-keto-4-pentenoate hydratase/2-oxohepta-3-ene-1,7-dioic acid hydratase in catechol pathway n=1 Tax=Amycolatopsis endophytica TaxID=860233 RepID=A0A853BC65_9PSEU|nr:fumarylacetoacetate hydrolase family protein [Amycolatopsis endophytica]NYI92344.1 2-keto-4-pentenoate hydratase/2-oxohepta-3-ene-1,7-dioic acid hydratase in catechol pathway [Amycolatopsis endophytica]
MRIANLNERAVLVHGDAGTETGVDVAVASGGRFGPDLPSLYDRWESFAAWAAEADVERSAEGAVVIDRARLAAPSPAPRQVFAVGLNYRTHAAESGFDVPTQLPPVFTKYVSSFAGPDTEVVLPPGGDVDWEIELVAVIGREARDIDDESAWDHIAGLTAGQDLSERVSQLAGPAPQFGLGKSFAGFSPQGPWLVTPDELPDRDDVELGCAIDGEEMQKGRTRDLLFPLPKLVAALSRTVTLYPGDVIFTGTPAGVGMGRDPRRFLRAGERLDSWIEGIGELHQTFVDPPGAHAAVSDEKGTLS